MANFTRDALMRVFIEQLENKSLDKITVKDIIEEAGVNRNTFYYHFSDIYDLIDKLFEEELQRIMSEDKEDATFYEDYKRAASIFLTHRKAIIHVEHSKSQVVVYKYIDEFTKVYVEKFVRKSAVNYNISEDGIRFITFFYSSAISANTIDWVHRGMPEYNDDFIKIVSSSFEATI